MEQTIQWLFEHPELCSATNVDDVGQDGGGGASRVRGAEEQFNVTTFGIDSDSESAISDASDSPSDRLSDQYAMYIRSNIAVGMTVRCIRNFVFFRAGDVGTVVKVDSEGLHDLNVQVDWQNHDSPYWMSFSYLEILSPPRVDIVQQIQVGSYVRLKNAGSRNRSLAKSCIGIVTNINGYEFTVDFPHKKDWTGSISELDLLPSYSTDGVYLVDNGDSSQCGAGGAAAAEGPALDSELIHDWSRSIKSLTVSSNESQAKHLLDRSSSCWTSFSCQGKHWIRLQVHENILVHSLSINVSPLDNSYMPLMVAVRTGETVATLRDFSWVAVKATDTVVPLLSDLRQHVPWIEITIKQCRNNGIQCKVHGLNIVGRRMATDLNQILENAAFLANETDTQEPNAYASYMCPEDKATSVGSGTGSSGADAQPANQCKVMVWGLNDKEQLGGLKGSKVKVPTFSTTLSNLRPIHIAGGSKSLFVVSRDGNVHACGEGTNGRLGLGHDANVATPQLVPVINQYVVKKVAVHSGGKHCLALTLGGKVFSWGEGDDGKLGHGNRLTLDKPKMIENLRSKRIRDVACGSSHSAAITSSGELYTWGLGEYGRLGHGDSCTQLRPKLVTALLGHRVVQVACGSRDAQTLSLTEEGLVFSWGDGDFGKLGRGGSEGCSVPHQIERLAGMEVIQIECGAQFSLALTKAGEVWTWGKGDYFRLGHGTDQHVRKPTPIQGLRGKKVIHVAVGALHCLAVTETGQVFGWGDNDHGQQGSGSISVNKKPMSVIGMEGTFVNRVACGSSHSIAWCLPQSAVEEDKKEPLPFATNKDPLGSYSLGIYDPEMPTTASPGGSVANKASAGTAAGAKMDPMKMSLSETLLGLESMGAKQHALCYVLNAMYVLQARQCIIASLVSHNQISSVTSEKGANDSDEDLGRGGEGIDAQQMILSTLLRMNSSGDLNQQVHQEVIVSGGGEGPAEMAHEFSPTSDNGLGLGVGPGAASGVSATLPLSLVGGILSSTSAFHSLNGSISLSGSLSSCHTGTHKHSKMSASAMSVMAATMTNQEEIIREQPPAAGLDDFTANLTEADARNLVELLILAVAGRCGSGPQAAETIAATLVGLGVSNPGGIGTMLLETCITELEDLCTSRHSLGKSPKPVVQETCHPYIDDITLVGQVKVPGAESLRVTFDCHCSTEKRNDPLIIMDGNYRVIATRSGREYSHWATEIRIPGDEMNWKFISDSSVNGWGWRFWVHGIMPTSYLQELKSDRAILCQPSIDLVIALLDDRLILPCLSAQSAHGVHAGNNNMLVRLVGALTACAQLSSLTAVQRIWSVKKLHAIVTAGKGLPKNMESPLRGILNPLVTVLVRQYEYEEPQVRGGIHLMHSDFFKLLAKLICDMQLDLNLPQSDSYKFAWLRRYCTAVRVAQALIKRTALPNQFTMEVRKKLLEMLPTPQQQQQQHSANSSMSGSTHSGQYLVAASPGLNAITSSNSATTTNNSLLQYIDSVLANSGPNSSITDDIGGGDMSASSQRLGPSSMCIVAAAAAFEDISATKHLHEDHSVFKREHDSQLLIWLNRRPEDWALSWGGASTIYGWGHNHRGQLGGLEGGRIKTPTPCEALSLLRPVQLAGGEQTLYAVTADGKLFATGYGAGGRLGIGGIESVSTPTLVESLQHVFVKKVAVNSGGKHCLALTSDGEVYSWGEGDDGKLGHGNRLSYDRPKLIEALTRVGVVDIACGSAHSACITAEGTVLTWGKGRYGRLGHGDSDDQLRPKLVQALLGHRAVDIACGSGDAQTLCITDDDNVWSWGDGDYGKLGRGGSDGCKIPTKIESLSGLGIVKVECGSQFSVALTRSGSVYTWGKGDYHRLGHGTVDHVRRPKKVTTLQGKKVVSIATGSLHCVACTDGGEVYTWGDNDEGQLGDGTVTAIQRPRLVTALQGKHIVKVTCGSAHTLALSTAQLSEGCRAPSSPPPLEYDLVRDLPSEALHARLVLLHHFSELICPCLSMLPTEGEDLSLSALKEVLVYSMKEASFRKVIQTTMVRDKQHGPVIELNRIRSRLKAAGALTGVPTANGSNDTQGVVSSSSRNDGMKTVFGQMVQKLPLLTQEALSLPHRVWKVKFVGESVDDCGGGYSESIAEMCDELQNGSVPLLIQTPNGRGEAGANQDCFLLDPTLSSVLQMNMFRFLGVLMGVAVRTGSPLSLNLAEAVWRQLAGETLRPADLTEVDRDYVAGLLCIRDMEDEPKLFQTLELPFSTPSAKGHEVALSTRYTRITPQNRQEYVRLALSFRLHEFDEQVKAVRDGMSKVIPVPLLSLFSAAELQAMVCGSPDIPLSLLKSVATYKGVEANSALVGWFWDVMEEFSNQERSLFLRFVWGRTRLPRTIADFRGRDFVLQVLDKYNPADHFLPESYTCFFLLKMPRYSCKVRGG